MCTMREHQRYGGEKEKRFSRASYYRVARLTMRDDDAGVIARASSLSLSLIGLRDYDEARECIRRGLASILRKALVERVPVASVQLPLMCGESYILHKFFFLL